MKKICWILSVWVLTLFLAACGGGTKESIPTYKVIKTHSTSIASIIMVKTSLGITEEQVKLMTKDIIEKDSKGKKVKKYRIEFYDREQDIIAGPTIASAEYELQVNATVDPQNITVKMVSDEERKGIQDMVDSKRIK